MSKTLAKRDPRDMTIAGFTLTATGLIIDGQPSFEDWQRVGAFIERAGSGVQWWIGDWLNYGEGRGEWGEMYDQAADIFGSDNKESVRKMSQVSEQFQFGSRDPDLDWGHHKAVMWCEAQEKEQLLEWALTPDPVTGKRKSCRDLEAEVRRLRLARGREQKDLPPGKFNLFYADPPWKYDFSKSDSRMIENKYPAMENEDICELPIGKLNKKAGLPRPQIRKTLRISTPAPALYRQTLPALPSSASRHHGGRGTRLTTRWRPGR